MPVKFIDVFSKTDWVKIFILVIVGAVAWSWVYIEYKKPILPIQASITTENTDK